LANKIVVVVCKRHHHESVVLCLCCVVDRGPLMALVLEKEEAVDSWKDLLGPTELDVALIEAPERLVHWVLFYPWSLSVGNAGSKYGL